jgi:hypothetical protein
MHIVRNVIMGRNGKPAKKQPPIKTSPAFQSHYLGKSDAFDDETADVGVDDATPVTEDYAQGNNRFNGKIRRVTIDLK